MNDNVNFPGEQSLDPVALMEQKARELKTRFIDSRVEWYSRHAAAPRIWFRWAGTITIVFSVTLPAIAAAQFPHKEVVLSGVSIAIAALTGLSSFFKWERTWQINSTTQVALQQQIAKWELELTNAKLLTSAQEQASYIYKATSDLLSNAASTVASESEGFFSGLTFPQQNSVSKD